MIAIVWVGGVLPMSGRWAFRVGFAEELLDLVVDVPLDLVGGHVSLLPQ